MESFLPKVTGAGLFDSRDKYPDTVTSALRHVAMYELELFVEDGGCSYVNNAAFPIYRGNLLVVRPGDERHSDLHFRCRYLHMECSVPQICQLLDSLAGVAFIDEYEKFETWFLQIEKYFLSTDPFDKCAILGVLLTMLQELRQNKQRQFSAQGSGKNEILHQAKEFVARHYAEEIGVSQIAEACHVSVSYLHRLFSDTLGYSPHKFLMDKRIFMAKKLLVGSSLTISQVASACGFNSQAYFSDCFKRREGVPPKEFRERSLHLA